MSKRGSESKNFFYHRFDILLAFQESLGWIKFWGGVSLVTTPQAHRGRNSSGVISPVF